MAVEGRLLVIDCATEACSVALFDGQSVLLAGNCEVLGRGHAERLVPMIGELPGKGRATRIAVDTGPGSFTGIRVGLAAARALALAWDAPLSGYESLALVAAMAMARHPGQAVDVALTGGHGEWFFQPFSARGEALAPLVSVSPGEAVARSSAPVVAGSQAEALAGLRGDAPVPTPLWPDAREFALLPEDALLPAAAPRYGRAPDAKLPGAAR